jgi:hypothetical protein
MTTITPPRFGLDATVWAIIVATLLVVAAGFALLLK